MTEMFQSTEAEGGIHLKNLPNHLPPAATNLKQKTMGYETKNQSKGAFAFDILNKGQSPNAKFVRGLGVEEKKPEEHFRTIFRRTLF